MRELLKEKRKQQGKTQAEIASKIGISTVHYRHIETGHVAPGRDLMIKIQNYYGVPAHKLFKDIFFLPNDVELLNKKEVNK
jgi:transcriptional regulator with XRE-family HTH domain